MAPPLAGGGFTVAQLLLGFCLLPALLALSAALMLGERRVLACGLHLAWLGLLVLGADRLAGADAAMPLLAAQCLVWVAAVASGLWMTAELFELRQRRPSLARGLWLVPVGAAGVLAAVLPWGAAALGGAGHLLVLLLHVVVLLLVLRQWRAGEPMQLLSLAFAALALTVLLQVAGLPKTFAVPPLLLAGMALLIELGRQVRAERRIAARLNAPSPWHTRREMLVLVSHELRAPLARIDASAQLILADPNLRKLRYAREELGKVRRAVKHLTGLIETLLHDGWLDAPATRFVPSLVDVGSLVQQQCETYESCTGRPIEVQLGSRSLRVFADGNLLMVALGNLLENADKFSPKGKTISVSARRDGAYVQIEVRDHGPGIDPTERESIFERHYRGAGSSRPGLGIGLHTVRRIMLLHDGKAMAASAHGGGAVFALRLPAAQPSR